MYSHGRKESKGTHTRIGPLRPSTTYDDNTISSYNHLPSPPPPPSHQHIVSHHIILQVLICKQTDCSPCRRATGSLATAYSIVPTEFPGWSGAARLIPRPVCPRAGIQSKSCEDCGTPLAFYKHSRSAKRTDCVGVTIASLADYDPASLEELGVAPIRAHVW